MVSMRTHLCCEVHTAGVRILVALLLYVTTMTELIYKYGLLIVLLLFGYGAFFLALIIEINNQYAQPRTPLVYPYETERRKKPTQPNDRRLLLRIAKHIWKIENLPRVYSWRRQTGRHNFTRVNITSQRFFWSGAPVCAVIRVWSLSVAIKLQQCRADEYLLSPL